MRLFIVLFFLSCCKGSPLKAVPDQLRSRECINCHFAVKQLQNAWGSDLTGDCFEEMLIFLCDYLHIESNFICKTAVSNWKDELIYVLTEVIANPADLCSLLVNDCGKIFDPFNATWQFPMPGIKPPVVEKMAVKPGKPTIRVLHLTDLHIDKDYTVGMEAHCNTSNTLTLCCRPNQDPDELSSSATVKQPAGYWGTIAQCDAPYWMVDNMLMQITERHKDIDYVMVTGDLESHAIWDYSKRDHADKIRNISGLLRQYFPNKMVYFAVGNHEGVPCDMFVPHSAPKKFNMDWLYTTMADSWKGWVPEDQMEMVKYNGCYMKKLFPGLRLISLNNGYGDSYNLFLLINQTDPDGTMSWFINQLHDAEKAGDKVHIIAHIPGGGVQALEGWSLNYYRAVNRFENTIAAQFFGHVHSEQFFMVYEDPEDKSSRPVDVIYSAPSVTPYSQFNPAYRIYTIDGQYPGSSYQVIDFEEHILNLTVANQPPYDPVWTSLYPSVVQEYGMSANLPSEWSNLIDRMKYDDQLFGKYLKNFYRRTNYPSCNEECRMNHLCSARKAHHSTKLCSDLKGATGVFRDDHPRPRGPPTSWNEQRRKHTAARINKNFDKCRIGI